VDVWTAAPIGAVGASAPQRSSGVKAAFRYLNAHGGLGSLHQPVTVKVCNTQLTPQGEIQCGQLAASDPKAIAYIAPIIVISTAPFMAELQKAGLPDVNPAVSDPSEATSPISFPLGAEILASAGCAAMAPKAVQATKIGFAGSATPVTAFELNAANAAAMKSGFTPVGTVTFPLTTTDVTPFVTQLNAKNPQINVLNASPQGVGEWLAAEARLGNTTPNCTTDALTPPQILLGLGGAAKGFYTAASWPDPTWSGYPVLAQFRAQAAAETAAGDSSASLAPANAGSEVLAGWMGAQAVIQAAANATGALTPATLLAALNHTTVTFGTGSGALIPPVDFAKPNPNPKYSRIFNPTMFLKLWNPAKQAFEKVPSVQPVNVISLVP
jgi:ABC-type branched-subunit amino acid transport system substrate-binding protein